jgi:hypothetical protein
MSRFALPLKRDNAWVGVVAANRPLAVRSEFLRKERRLAEGKLPAGRWAPLRRRTDKASAIVLNIQRMMTSLKWFMGPGE